MTKRYFDRNLTIRKHLEITKGKFIFVTFEDFFWGKWYGNLGIFDIDGTILYSCRIKKAYTRKQLERYADKFIAFRTAGGELWSL